MFGFTHFGHKKYTFIDTYCQQEIVADVSKRTSFFAHVSHKNSKLIIFFKGDKWVKLVFRRLNYKKLSNDYEKVAKKRKELLEHYFLLCSKAFNDFLVRNHSRYVTILPSWVVIDTVIVET